MEPAIELVEANPYKHQWLLLRDKIRRLEATFMLGSSFHDQLALKDARLEMIELERCIADWAHQDYLEQQQYEYEQEQYQRWQRLKRKVGL